MNMLSQKSFDTPQRNTELSVKRILQGKPVPIDKNHYTRNANNLQPENTLTYGWNAEVSVNEKLPKTFKNMDKGTLRQIDQR